MRCLPTGEELRQINSINNPSTVHWSYNAGSDCMTKLVNNAFGLQYRLINWVAAENPICDDVEVLNTNVCPGYKDRGHDGGNQYII